MEIKTTLRFHVTPVRMAFIKKIKNVGKDEQNISFFLFICAYNVWVISPPSLHPLPWCEYKSVQLRKSAWSFLKILKIELPHCHSPAATGTLTLVWELKW
jgi:hypothetical protein